MKSVQIVFYRKQEFVFVGKDPMIDGNIFIFRKDASEDERQAYSVPISHTSNTDSTVYGRSKS